MNYHSGQPPAAAEVSGRDVFPENLDCVPENQFPGTGTAAMLCRSLKTGVDPFLDLVGPRAAIYGFASIAVG